MLPRGMELDMPAVVAPLIIEGLLSAGVAFGAASFIASTVLPLAASFVLSSLAGSLAPKPKRRGLGDRATGRQEMIRSAIVPRRTIYGTAMVSGPIVHAQTHGTAEGIPNAYLSLIVALAGHEVDAIEEVWLGDERGRFLADGITLGSPFSTRAKADPGNPDIILNPKGVDFAEAHRHLGALNQAADSRLVADAGGKWTVNHRLRGIAYVHARLLFDRAGTLFADGVPKIRCKVRGRKVLDTRNSITAWSNNPALIVHDYLTTTLGVGPSEIELASVDAAANVCDELVALKAGTTQKRYTCDGTVDADERPADVLRDLLGAMAGTLVYAGGRFHLHAGAAATPSLTLGEADMAGPIVVHPRIARRELYNGVKAIYVDRKHDWQPRAAPVVSAPGYVAEDGGATIVHSLDLPFTTDAATAQRLGKIQLLRARQGIAVELPVRLVGLGLSAWDTVGIDNARLGWNGKSFRVVGWRLEDDLTVGLSLREESDAAWAWSASEESEVDPAPDTDLPSPFTVPAPGAISVTETLEVTASGAFVTRLTITIDPVPDGFRVGYEAQIKKSSVTAWSNLGRGEAERFEYAGAVDGESYDIRVRTQNSIGQFSDWTQVTYVVAGQTAPPEDVTGFAVNIRGAEALLAWNAVGDVDLSHYRVRWASALVAATWAGAIDLVGKVARPATSVTVPALIGTYLIKAVDLKGNESVNAAAIITTIAGVAGLNVVSTIAEDPTFGGTHSSTTATGGVLKLDTAALFDSGVGNFDDGQGLFDSGSGTIASEGTYTFAGSLDLGQVFTSRLTAALTVTAESGALLFDSGAGNFDDGVGLFDGEMPSQVNARVQVRTTLDNPGGSPTWTAWADMVVGDYRARGFQFRVKLTSEDAQATPLVSALSVTVDMPDRTAEEHDVASGAGAKVVTFPGGAFRVVPAIGVSAQGLATGDFYEITAKSASGFTITFKNSGGSPVSRTFDYIARGYGVAA